MSVITFPRYSANGPSSRVRFFQYFPYLEAAGFNLQVQPFFGNDYIQALFSKKGYPSINILQSYANRVRQIMHIRPGDTVWLQYELLPWLPAFLEKILLDKRARLVIDYDDAIFHRYDQHDLTIVRGLLGKKIGRMMKTADVVVAGNQYLAEYAHRAGAKRVEIIPSVVNLNHYPLKEYEKKPHKVRVGWLGSPQTVKFLSGIAPSIRELVDQGIEFVIIGAKSPGELDGLAITEIPWSLETEAQSIRSLDVGIMPLSDTPFERGKCGYKLIQYMACGLPVVASPVGVNQNLVMNGENGFLAESVSEWSTAISELVNDHDLRQRMGSNGRALVEKDFNLDKWAPVLNQILSD